MKIKIISKEQIKPASPTPDHLRIYKISLLDQMIPCIYVSAVLYFAGGAEQSNISRRIQLLKDSLSSTLSTFYPFAGVIRDSLSADCNDQGLPFSVAKVKGQITDFLQNPNVDLINKFFPSEYNPEKPPGPGANLMLIQMNCFDCGGIALSVIFAHYVADLPSISTFLRAWAAGARGSPVLSPLNCIAQSSFPQKAALPMESIPFNVFQRFLSVGKFVTRRYVFDESALSILKAELTSPSDSTPITRVNVVTAVMWKCFMAAVAAEDGDDLKPFLFNHAVNLRRRAAPPFSDDSFGNFQWLTPSLCTYRVGKGLRELVGEVKKGIAKVDGGFVKRFETDDDDDFYEYFEELVRNETPEEAKWLGFTSWVNSGLYDVDFGWGRPVWLSGIVSHDSELETMYLNNVVTLMDTRGGDGIEAWVILDQKYVAGFERNEEIHKYARINPSAL